MKNLLMTTMLVSALAAVPSLAQTSDLTADQARSAQPTLMPEFAAPEGFTLENRVLTAEDLLGARIHDAAGDAIGNVHDFVLDVAALESGSAPPSADSGAMTPPADGLAEGTGGNAGTGVTPGAAPVDSNPQGRITHAILDIGGFLGVGAHRVAVPISDLLIYRSDAETRIYLPWTQEQLEATPQYDPQDANTLGQSYRPDVI